MKFDPTLYLVTDSTGRTDDDFLSILEKALTGGVTLVQLLSLIHISEPTRRS